MYTKTDDVMLDRDIKKLRKLIEELQDHVERLNKFRVETIADTHGNYKCLERVLDKFKVYEDRFKKIEKILEDEAWAENKE